ncbi:DNA replication/repair protein RecF [Aeromicrobium phragmitis]|uniref:DNA replication and repair protein RecF n=1 Tax=Aeromicrobium phragmitis TaxID=2478914 RepID=A0A3L8PPJ5_9ACTN|nr:DNA replication/repair protein RecF [Aeromicrobium phragmitis]RLV57291.1 DNA replication/repair protein RecF [Aeromicrobium phragmitis]
MHVARLSLVDFRSYPSVDIELSPGATAFVGANGQGKTNLVEAIDYLSRLDSHRVASDAPLVRAGAERAVVRADVVKEGRSALIELEITPGKANRARVNRNAVPRIRDLVGTVRTIIFSPEDLALVKGDPSDRRRFLDGLLVLRTPRLAGIKADYERTLRQRNTLLKSAGRRRDVDLSTLDIWDENLARIGGQLTAARLALLDALAPYATRAYGAVAAAAAEDRQSVGLTYRSSAQDLDPDERDADAIAKSLTEHLDQRRRDELERGVSLVGPHRDEVVLSIGDLPAKGYASHGESWSLALALKLAAFDLVRDDGDDPILILDDVFAELDQRRREHLAELVGTAEQVLVTAAVEDDVPEGLSGRRFTVRSGEVKAHDVRA